MRGVPARSPRSISGPFHEPAFSFPQQRKRRNYPSFVEMGVLPEDVGDQYPYSGVNKSRCQSRYKVSVNLI